METSQRGPKPSKLPSPEVSQASPHSSTQPSASLRVSPSRASTCLSPATWKLGVLAAPTSLQNLSYFFSEAADAPPHRCPRVYTGPAQVLARESHGVFFLPRQLLPHAKGTAGQTVSERPGWHNLFFRLRDWTLPAFLRQHSPPRANSNTPRASYTANLKSL